MTLARKTYGEDCLWDLGRAASEPDSYHLDLSQGEWMYPSCVVGLSLLLRYRAQKELQTLVTPPDSGDLRNYLNRIDFFKHLPGYVYIDGDVSNLANNQRNSSDRFTELLLPRKQGFEAIENVVATFLKKEISTGWQRTYSAFDESLQNVRDHAGHLLPNPVYSCAHVQVYSNRIELAFGDLGVGFLRTLRTNPAHGHLRSEEEALRGALERKFTRWHRPNEHHGGGLHQVGKVARKMKGRLVLLTGDAIARQYVNGKRSYTTYDHRFPGTIVWVRLPVS